MRILLIGSSGMAGHVILLHLLDHGDFDVDDMARSQKIRHETICMDAQDITSVRSLVKYGKYDRIINCTGILNRDAEEHKADAVFINSYFPHYLALLATEYGGSVIHLSTDCVFSGKSGGYAESDFRDGDSFYDRSKALGELINKRDLTIRTSIIGPDLDPEGIGLFNWFMRSSGDINGFTKAIWSGVTTITLAKQIFTMLESPTAGLVHLTCMPPVSKFDLINLFSDVFHRDDVVIHPDDRLHMNKSLMSTRPDFSPKIPSYMAQLIEMRSWMLEHKELYGHYMI